MMEALELLVGVIVGVVLGLTGAGGSVLAVPLFLDVLGQPMQTAVGLSLGVVAIGAVVGALSRFGSGLILLGPALIYSASGALVTTLGQELGSYLSDAARISLFSILVAIVARRMWLQAATDPESTRVVRAGAGNKVDGPGPACKLSPSGKLEMRPRCLSRLVFGGALTGLLSGMFGVGGGFVIVPTLVLFTGIDMHRAVATSLLVITLVASTGFAGYVARTDVLPMQLFRNVSLGVVGGMALGTGLGKYLAGPRLTRLFVVVMLGMTSLTLFNTLFASG